MSLTQKAFESLHAGFDEWFEIFLVVWDDASPEPDVDKALSFGCVEFQVEILDGRRRRNRIQRHVDQRSHSARDCGLGDTAQGIRDCRIGDERKENQLLTIVPVLNPSHSVLPGSFR